LAGLKQLAEIYPMTPRLATGRAISDTQDDSAIYREVGQLKAPSLGA
jgi:hypothetical protein